MTLFLVLLALYLAGMLAIGAASYRLAGRGRESFFVADRSFGTLRGFAGLASTTTGGSTTIVLALYVYTRGISGIWLDLAGALGLLLLGLFLARGVRRTGAVTLPEIVGRFYGQDARVAAALLVVCAEIVWFALLIEATQKVLAAAFGLPTTSALLVSAAVFIAYTVLGGQYAVVGTDLAQYAIMVAGILLVAVPASLTGAGGLAGLPRDVWSFPASSSMPSREILTLLVLVGLPHLVGSDVYSKLLSCRDEATSRRAACLAALSKIAFGAGVAAIALAARKAMAPLSDPAQALPAAILHFTAPPLAAFVLVAMVATMQSSSDSVLLTAAAVTVHDVAPRLLGRQAPMSATRLLTALYGACGLLVALGMKDIVDTLKLGYSIFAAGLILPILCGFFSKRLWVPRGDALVAMIAGGAIAAAGRFLLRNAAVDPVLLGTGANAAVLAAAIARTRLLGRCPGDYLPNSRRGDSKKG